MRASRLFFVALSLNFLALAACAQETQTQPPISDIPQAVAGLSKIDVGQYPSGAIPDDAGALLVRAKHGLRELAAYLVNHAPEASPEQLTQAARVALASANVPLMQASSSTAEYVETPEAQARAEFEDRHPFGSVDIHFDAVPKFPSLMTATISLSAVCATDSSIYVFERGEASWRLAMAVETNDYGDNGGPQSDGFDIGGDEKHWWLLKTNIGQWCTSNWHGIAFRVLRAGGSPDSPEVLLRGHDGIYLGVDEPVKTRTSAIGFDIVFEGSQSLDAGVLVRPHIRRYRLHDGKFLRVAPAAFSAEGFLDEWLRMPWDEARQWTDKQAMPSARVVHDFFGRVPKGDDEEDEKRYVSAEFSFVQPCSGDNRWQIGVIANESDEIVFGIRRPKAGVYFVTFAGRHRPRGCPGDGSAEPENGQSLPDFPPEGEMPPK